MKTVFTTERRLTTAKSKIRKHLHMVGWLLFAAAMTEWQRWSRGSAADYVPDFDRFQSLWPLALVGLIYLWDAVGPGFTGLFRREPTARTHVPGWIWIGIFAIGTLVSLWLG
jgi:hypothetical protein